MTDNDENDPNVYKFNWHELPENDFTHWAVVTFDADTPDDDRLFTTQLIESVGGTKNMTIEIIVNGIPINAESFMRRLDRATDGIAERIAAKKVDELMPWFEQMEEFMDDLTKSFKKQAYAKAKELGIDSSEWEEQW